MNFLYPFGLLGLIGIPILIIIYIIKNKYTEQTIASTYIWTLSEKFLKRKRPVSQLVGILSLILQILAVTFISFAIAHPVIVKPNSAHEYCFVIDASASMQMTDGEGVTRFEKGKSEIARIINESDEGSFYTLTCVDGGVNVVYRKATDKATAISAMESLAPTATEMNVDGAIKTAQEIFDANAAAKIYLVTDVEYSETENVEVINVAKSVVNYSIQTLNSATIKVDEEQRVYFTGSVKAHGLASSDMHVLNLTLYVDGEIAKTATVNVSAGEEVFEIQTDCETYSKAKLVINNADAFSEDNEFVLFNIEKENLRKTLIVSEEGFFLQSIIEALNSTPEIVTPAEYTAQYQTGYDLYVFDRYSPEKMPVDGAVWFFAPPASIPNSGFALQGEVKMTTHAILSLTDDSASLTQKLVANLSGKEDVAVTEFMQYSTYRSFTTLYSYKSIPMVFTGTAATGYREVVFAFDIHDSNMPMLYDFPILMNNLWSFSFPDVVESVVCEGGSEVHINAVPGCESIRVDAPDGSMQYPEIGSGASIFTPDQVGEYLITMKVGEERKTYNIYCTVPNAEREVDVHAQAFSVSGQAEAGGLDGIEDIILIAFIILAVMFVADWMVYCYDKYQLR